MSYTSEQRDHLDQMEYINFRIGKVKNEIRHLEDNKYALEKHCRDLLKALEECEMDLTA